MKNIIQILTLITFFIVTTLTARDVSGKLGAGEGSSFVPAEGSAFSIISDLSCGIYDGRFDIVIKNGGRIIYQEENQVDDLYLVFNESIDDGDYIKLDVKKGVFIFKMTHMSEIPDVIADAIKSQAPVVYDELKPLHKRKKRKPIVEKEPEPIVTPMRDLPIARTQPMNVDHKQEDNRVIKRHISPEVYRKSIADKVKKVAPSLPKIDTKIPSQIVDKPTSSSLDKISSSIDRIKKENIATTALENSQIEKITNSALEKASQQSKITTPAMASSGIANIPSTPSFSKESSPSSIGMKSTIPKVAKITAPTLNQTTNKKELPKFSSKIEPVVPVLPSSSKATIGKFKTTIETNPVQTPSFAPKNPDVIVKRLDIDKVVTPPVSKPIVVPKQVQKHVNIPKPVATPVKTYKEPDMVVPKPVVIPKPKVIEKPYVDRSAKKDKIVITKTIIKPKKDVVQEDEPRVIKRHVQPSDYRREQRVQEEESIPMRMSDRVLGNGYGMATPGKLKVKAYSNNRPVSAWVEVFKADTKQRVKTFYTGKGRGLKDVKLPAGVYVIKATYRTSGSKRKKTIGRITLDDGESINRSISFDDGAIKVTATKNGEPLYAKVEVFKSGKKRRVAYAFTSKKDGRARISIGSGVYDIVVKDHNNVRRYDSIRIRGNKSKSFNADF